MSLRIFVAVTPPDEVIEHLSDYLEPRHDVPSPLRWTPAEQWHLTLAFMPTCRTERWTSSPIGWPTSPDRIELQLATKGSRPFPNPAEAECCGPG